MPRYTGDCCLVLQDGTQLIVRLAVSMRSDSCGLESNEYVDVGGPMSRSIYTMRKSLWIKCISFLQSTGLLGN